MSYSFSINAATKSEARQRMNAEFQRVVDGQPEHAHDRSAAQAAAEAMIDCLAGLREGEAIILHVNGSLSWAYPETDKDARRYLGANVSVNASIGPAT